MPMLGLLLKLLNQWVPPPYLRWLLLGINLHQLDFSGTASAISMREESPPHCTGMVAMTGKARQGALDPEMELRLQRNALTYRAEGNASTIGFRPYRDVNWDADLNTALEFLGCMKTNAASTIGWWCPCFL
jgi:hypothetical protein